MSVAITAPKIVIRLDVREKPLIERVQQNIRTIPWCQTLCVQVEALAIGDIVISDKITETEHHDLVILERKTTADLLASIKDGRYEEQSYRLNGLEHPNHNVFYLIEGEMGEVRRGRPSSYGSPTDKMLYSAMFSLNYYKGFSVWRSRDLDETAFIVCHMAHKIHKEWNAKTPYYKSPCVGEETLNGERSGTASELPVDDRETSGLGGYSSVIKKVKKDNITPDNIAEIMLCQIPHVSSVTASVIMSRAGGTLGDLIRQWRERPEEFDNLTYTNSKGQVRKIGKNVLSNVKSYLHI